MSKTTKTVLALILALVLVAGVACAWYFGYYRPRQEAMNSRGEGDIAITVTITHTDETVNTYTVKTNALYLSDALLEAELMEAHEDIYGLYIDAMDGEKADMAENKAWCFDKNGASCETGVSTTPIADGDTYAFYILTW